MTFYMLRYDLSFRELIVYKIYLQFMELQGIHNFQLQLTEELCNNLQKTEVLNCTICHLRSPVPECPISHSLFPIYPAPFNLSQTTHLLHIPHLIKWLNGPHLQVVGTKVMNQKTCTHTFYI